MDEMKVLSVNVGKAEHIDGYKPLTGICKKPVLGRVEVHELGLDGDAIMDTKNHGGLDQAVYLFGQPDYDVVAKATGRAFTPGLFGENLTVAGLECQHLLIGDRFEIGNLLLEVSCPRIPCATFAARMHDPQWVKTFFAINRAGAMARVLRTGWVEAGMAVRHIPFAGPRVPLIELMQDYKSPAPERMRYLLQAPIHRDLVALYQDRLAQGSLF